MTAVWICCAVIAALILLFLFLIFPAARRHPHLAALDGKRIAHRGLHDLSPAAPENSLAAFDAAWRAGYMIETDLHITADGEVVVFHDDTLDRMCGVSGKPEEKTLAELRELRLGGTEERIPTLKELLSLVNGRVPLLIEFKCTDGETCRRLCEAADAILSRYDGRYFVQSFYPLMLRWYRKHRPDVCRGQLASAFRGDKLKMRVLGDLVFNFMARPDFVSYEYTCERHPCRRICTALGAFPICWTLHSEEELCAAKKRFRTFIFENFIPSSDS